jgi:hypothetical protein
MIVPRIDWEGLQRQYATDLVDIIRSLFSNGGPFVISAETMASQTSRPEAEAEKLLDVLCPPLTRISVLSCPNCKVVLGEDEAQLELCPECHQQHAEHGGVQVGLTFAYHADRTRDVIWVLALHGMNTRGQWQEEFNWRVSRTYSRSVPVAIYKYGLVRPGAIWRPSLRLKTERLIAKIQALQGDSDENGFASPPDVIAHSLGTWLIGHALQSNPSLTVGRIILTGSILRPDFDWAGLVARGQVEAVLNHYGTRDFWAGVAHFVIPDSGPSGKHGFNGEAGITQVAAEGFGHSDFFSPKNLTRVFSTVWQPFLTGRIDIESAAAGAYIPWRPTLWIFRATILPFIFLAVYWACVVILGCSCLFGLYAGYHWLRGA